MTNLIKPSLMLPLVMLTLVGCGSKPAAHTSNNTTAAAEKSSTAKVKFDPCSVLSTDAVTAIVKEKITRTEVIDHDCHYHTNLDDDGTVVAIYPTGGKEELQNIRDANKLLGGIGAGVAGQGDVGKDVQSAITPPAAGNAPSIGDESVWQPNDVLGVRKGDLFVSVTPPIAHDPASHPGAMLISSADKRVMARKLAEAVLAKSDLGQ
jgi:hypothetical protein